ncbi:unnamed protein product [Knipowitschia caucasica]|uniref:Uncharacterized protein n=1 Tax=Knipowitschia caucasica TaxID=637954 RepID=A0AAV2LM43_KNICA
MDEAEKYKQRLEAIAEKRRLMEEQERAKRDMEDERIRLQQLKRKSLRDQWLMEAPPLSPSSLETPRSMWGTQVQDNGNHIEKLESQTQQLVEAEEELTEEVENGQMEAAAIEEMATEIVQNVLRNGKYTAESGEQIPAVTLSQDLLHTVNGLSAETKTGPEVNLNNNNVEDEEEGTIVIRAECIMITDEGDDTADDDTKENCGGNYASISDETQKTVIESRQTESTVDCTAEVEPPENAKIPNGVQEGHLDDTEDFQLHTQTHEGAVVSSVPVYTQACMTTAQVEVENEVCAEETAFEVVSKPKGNVKVEFQQVALSEGTKGPCEPLLSDVTNPCTRNEAERTNTSDKGEAKMNKRKTCQCCSVM